LVCLADIVQQSAAGLELFGTHSGHCAKQKTVNFKCMNANRPSGAVYRNKKGSRSCLSCKVL
jgi:hypothetical protein